jgi:hypothetical protein
VIICLNNRETEHVIKHHGHVQFYPIAKYGK